MGTPIFIVARTNPWSCGPGDIKWRKGAGQQHDSLQSVSSVFETGSHYVTLAGIQSAYIKKKLAT